MDSKYILESVFQAVLGTGIQMLLDRIASSDFVSYIMGKKDSDFQSLVKRLEIMMRSLTGVLDDAEQRQIRDDPRVEAWLDQVQEAVFDAEDFLDEIEYEALHLKVTGDSGAGTSEVRQPKRPKLFSFSRNSKDRDLESGIRNILDRLEEIAKQKELLGLKETLAEKKQWQRPPSTCLVDESLIFGRDAEKESMIKLLVSGDDTSGGEKISVIPIVGMGGIGKTTLAQTVFNHSRVKEAKFDLMLWVCVSENYDIHRTTSELLFSGSSSYPLDGGDLNSLQVRLRDKLAGKKFLIVLDDVWNDKAADWEVMRMPFKDGAQGSKIVVTTRSKDVADVTGNVPTHYLDVLTEEISWKLFAKHAFGNEVDTNPELEKIGREIMKKCGGLPLAVKTLGRLLHSKLDIVHWKGILASEIWELKDSQSDILPALRLSYYCLPSYLKRCFAYCALFPKDREIEKEELVSLWMAQGLLERPQGNVSIEEVGDQYINDLLSMSFFQPSRMNNCQFIMHDLIVDLAIYVSRKYFSRLEGATPNDEVIKETTRHIACDQIDDVICERFNSILKATLVRSFMEFNYGRSRIAHTVSKGPIQDFFLKLKHLRSYSSNIEKCGALDIDSICELRHLRFLKLSDSSIKHLPDSLCTLYNLQTLKLTISQAGTLPQKIHHLINLRHLKVSSKKIEEVPESLSRLSNLQKLVLRECQKLNKLPKDLHHLINLRYLDASNSALVELPESLGQLSGLQELHLIGCQKLNQLPKDLHHLISLRYLDASYSGLEELPESFSQMPNLQHLNLSNCRKIKKLPESFHLLVNLSYLNVTRTILEDMPTQICKLQGLHTLRTFVVGKDRGASLRELANLKNLRGELCIKNLQNVVNPEDDLEVKPIEKLHLQELEFEWSSQQTNDTRRELRVLETLVPHTSLVRLKISGYGGTKFPDWLSHHSYCNIVSLTLFECNNCASLPQLGQLPSLKTLEIGKFDAVVEVGPEFYGTSSAMLTKPFASLEELSFHGMRNWKDWSMPDGDDVAFPKLKNLRLLDCNSLEGDFRRFLPTLISLSFVNTQQYRAQLWHPPTALQSLTIGSYSGTEWLWTENLPPNLTTLSVYSCKELKFLPENMRELLPVLIELKISDCGELESFPTSGLPLSLRSLRIERCDKLVASRRNWNLQALPNLEEFSIGGYSGEDMESFPEQGLLPTTLTRLRIFLMSFVKRLNNTELQQLTSLKSLLITGCSDLQTMMTEEPLPGSLEYLWITGCPLLSEKLEKERGEYWNHISHIPYTTLDSTGFFLRHQHNPEY